jgi:hypothetical protein
MLVFLFLVALAIVGFAAGRMRRAPAFLDGAALAGLAALLLVVSGSGIGLGIHILPFIVGLLCLGGGFVGGASSDVKNMNRRRLGGGRSGGLLGR